MWIANRNSSDITQVSLCGEVLQTVPIGTNLRRLKVAPDGKLWVIKFIQGTFDIRNPDGTLFLTVTASLGNPYDVAFDVAGHAWVSGGSGVEEFDANGIPVATYPLPISAPLGITIDVAGNKWIAHRVAPPGSISRIDGSGVVTSYALPPTSVIQPTQVMADTRGFGTDSHIWVVGDSGNTLAEFDMAGNALNAYAVGTTGLSSLALSPTGDIWIGNYSNGQILQVDPATGNVLNTLLNTPTTLGVAFDSFNRLWATTRQPTGTPSEVRRLDSVTGNADVPVMVGMGTQSDLSSRHHFALVVNGSGDEDGDSEANLIELLNGTSPYDAQSNNRNSILATGPTAIGSTFTLQIVAAPSSTTSIAIASSLLPAPGISLPGVTGNLWLDPTTIVFFGTSPFIITVPGFVPLPVPIALDPGLIGTVISAQGLVQTGASLELTNATCISIY
jgi:streptogramin lyase